MLCSPGTSTSLPMMRLPLQELRPAGVDSIRPAPMQAAASDGVSGLWLVSRTQPCADGTGQTAVVISHPYSLRNQLACSMSMRLDSGQPRFCD